MGEADPSVEVMLFDAEKKRSERAPQRIYDRIRLLKTEASRLQSLEDSIFREIRTWGSK